MDREPHDVRVVARFSGCVDDVGRLLYLLRVDRGQQENGAYAFECRTKRLRLEEVAGDDFYVPLPERPRLRLIAEESARTSMSALARLSSSALPTLPVAPVIRIDCVFAIFLVLSLRGGGT